MKRTPASVLAAVAGWELRRLLNDRGAWVVGFAALAVCLGFAWLKHSWGRPVADGVQGESILILGTTRVGIPYLMIEGMFVLFAPLIPFCCSRGRSSRCARPHT